MIKKAKKFLLLNSTAITLLVIFNMSIIEMLLGIFIGKLPSIVIMWSTWLIFYLISLRKTPHLITRKDVMMFSIWVVILLFSVYRLQREQNEYMREAYNSIRYCTAFYFLGKMVSINNKEDYMSLFSWSPVICVVLFALIYSTGGVAGAKELMFGYRKDNPNMLADYSMYLGYRLLPNLVIAIFLSLNGRKWQIPLMLVMFMIVFSAGTRGPIVCALGAFTITFLSKINLRSWKLWLSVFIFSIIAILILVNYEAILRWLLKFLKNANLSTRIVTHLLDGNFTNSSGRTELYKGAIKGINEYLFTGTGIYRDRQYLVENYNNYYPLGYKVLTSSTGSYSHSILFDLPLQLGLFVGGTLLFLYFRMLIKVWRQMSKQSRLQDDAGLIYVILLSICLFPTFFGGSFPGNRNLYLLMGFALEQLKHKTGSRGINSEKHTLTENS